MSAIGPYSMCAHHVLPARDSIQDVSLAFLGPAALAGSG